MYTHEERMEIERAERAERQRIFEEGMKEPKSSGVLGFFRDLVKFIFAD